MDVKTTACAYWVRISVSLIPNSCTKFKVQFFDECENSEISFKKKIVNPWKRTVVLNSKKPCGFEAWFSYYIDLYTSH